MFGYVTLCVVVLHLEMLICPCHEKIHFAMSIVASLGSFETNLFRIKAQKAEDLIFLTTAIRSLCLSKEGPGFE